MMDQLMLPVSLGMERVPCFIEKVCACGEEEEQLQRQMKVCALRDFVMGKSIPLCT